MPELLHPGVYVQEVASGVQPIQGVGTSTAAFIGITDQGPLPGQLLGSGIPAQAGLVTSFGDYQRRYGGFRSDSFLTYAVQAFFGNGGQRLYVVRVAADDAACATLSAFTPASPPQFSSPPSPPTAPVLTALNQGNWGNSIWVTASLSSDGQHFKLVVMSGATLKDAQQNIVEAYDNLALATSGSVPPASYAGAVINSTSEYINVTAPITATPPFGVFWQLTGGSDGGAVTTADFIGAASTNALAGTGLYALDKITDVSLIAIPGRGDVQTINAGVDYCKYGRPLTDCFFVGDVGIISDVQSARTAYPSTGVDTIAQAAAFAVQGDGTAQLDTAAGDYGAIYYPWVFVADPIGTGTNPKILIPPSGIIAGIYARTDNSRGVFKAPAGTQAGVAGALAPAIVVSDSDQDSLNPVYVNAIRSVPGSGLVVWGARTFGSDAQWRYVPVRRMAIFLRTSLYYGIQWAVFEPNDEPLWANLRLNITSFMMTQFRSGAFQGSSPADAFFVACDASTTTQQDIDLGIVNILVGFAPLKPAEFVVLKLSQKVNQSAT